MVAIGIALIVGGFLCLKLVPNRPHTRWLTCCGGLTVGSAILLYEVLSGPQVLPHIVARQVAALLGVVLALVVWAVRWRCGELGRVRVHHPGIIAGQLMCVVCCVYVVAVCAYMLVSQLALAMIQSWSYTLLDDSAWLFDDLTGVIDLIGVAGVCLVMTRATRSALLMAPLFWVLLMALLWQCLLIPPVITDGTSAVIPQIGPPSHWALAMMCGSATLVFGFVVLQGWSWRTGRNRAWQLDIRYLLRRPRSWPGLQGSVLWAGLFVAMMGIILLIFPSTADAFRRSGPPLAAAAAALVAGVAVFLVVHRHWREGLGELAFGLLTMMLCMLGMLLVPAEPVPLVQRFPMILNALVLSCAVATGLWMWLAGVWVQQLMPGGWAWTTAGRLIPAARRSSFMAAAFGVVFALGMGMWPLENTSDDNSWGRVLCGTLAVLVLIGCITWSYLCTRRPAFRSLVMLSTFALVLFGYIRYLPFTSYW